MGGKIAIKDIMVGLCVRVDRPQALKIERGSFTMTLTSTVGLISHIPEHRKFCTVQFFNQKGKPIYRESFFWDKIIIIDRPEGFKGELV